MYCCDLTCQRYLRCWVFLPFISLYFLTCFARRWRESSVMFVYVSDSGSIAVVNGNIHTNKKKWVHCRCFSVLYSCVIINRVSGDAGGKSVWLSHPPPPPGRPSTTISVWYFGFLQVWQFLPNCVNYRPATVLPYFFVFTGLPHFLPDISGFLQVWQFLPDCVNYRPATSAHLSTSTWDALLGNPNPRMTKRLPTNSDFQRVLDFYNISGAHISAKTSPQQAQWSSANWK